MARADRDRQTDRALGALLGGALGDALGMPTQTLSREEIVATYGEITDFVAPAAGHAVSHGLVAGSITDDTEQTMLLAGQIIASPDAFDQRRWAEQLMAWEVDIRRRGLLDLLGPSTKRALEALLKGQPASETGQFGDTNGAAMRIAPVGIATPAEPLSRLVDHVETVCRITHNTAAAIASAAAVAATISAGIDGAAPRETSALALAAAREGGCRGHGKPDVAIADRVALALDLAAGGPAKSACVEIARRLGTDVASRQSVPTAFGIFMATGGDVWQAGLIAANIGGDTDTIGAIACAMAGACGGAAKLPQDKVATLNIVNNLAMDGLVRDLLEVRRTRAVNMPAVEPVL